jgi:predicted ABC-type ATPase
LRTETVLTVIAGPNGSGKSTITESIKIVGLYINADEIKRRSGCSDREAAVEAEKVREFCLANGTSFAFETVLSTHRNLDLIARAKVAGFFVDSYFVLTADPELNVKRVRSRAAYGGHDVPPDKTRGRYARSLANIPELIGVSDRVRIVDNTYEPYVIYVRDGEKEALSPNGYWSYDDIVRLVRGAEVCQGDV